MIKLIASDIDGTLVKDGTLAIDREYMEVIGRLIDKGIVFVACSGRQYRSERKLFAPVADRLLYISDGGTVVRTPKEILKVDTLPDEIWKGMCSMVRENMPSCDYFISTPERCFAEDGGSQMFHWLRDSYGYDIHEVPEMLKLEGQQVNKFAVYHPNACEEMCAPFIHSHLERQNSYGCRRQGMDGLYCPRFRQRSFRCFPSGISGNFT